MTESLNQKLSGKVALVTGGSRGIGAAIAQRLAKDGATVAISYSASADKANALVQQIEKTGGKAAAFKADQAKRSEVEKLVKDVAAKFGKLDILVNNAGVFVGGELGNLANDEAAFDHQFAVNVIGVAAAVKTAAAILPKGGRIVTIGSVVGDSTQFAGAADYSATKAAVAGYTRGWSRDLGPKGITVNTVQPGPIATDMNTDDDGDFATLLKSKTSLGRYGKPEEVAAAVAFLVGPDAEYITGTTLNVDGGMNA